jgi:mono/diheme cytochrome c family protein
MRPILWFVLGAIAFPVVIGLAGLVYLKTGSHGFSARDKPMGIEKFAAVQARLMAMPSDAKNKQNPVPKSAEVIAEGRAHWADHCATCHANNGSGETEMGKNMYPPAPDMRKGETQERTDGELFYVIENGVRLSGMPAWGTGSHEDQESSWKLVRFIRHLPNISPEEISEMEKLNPKSPEEFQEEQEELQFLKGQPSNPSTSPNQHHH